MTKSTTITISGIGPVLFERSAKARRVSISVRPFKGIRVAVPFNVSFDKAGGFVHEHSAWIQGAQARVACLERRETALEKKVSIIDRKDARKILVARLAVLAERYGFTYNRVSIRNQRTRWGSCSGPNNINLNVKLLLLPSELRDFIILHELVHTRIKDHGPKFWRLLESCEPKARELDRRMRGQPFISIDQE